VSFRTIDDSDDEIREDKIYYNLVEEYGYAIEDESLSIFLISTTKKTKIYFGRRGPD
jgi:hypothetical protein